MGGAGVRKLRLGPVAAASVLGTSGFQIGEELTDKGLRLLILTMQADAGLVGFAEGLAQMADATAEEEAEDGDAGEAKHPRDQHRQPVPLLSEDVAEVDQGNYRQDAEEDRSKKHLAVLVAAKAGAELGAEVLAVDLAVDHTVGPVADSGKKPPDTLDSFQHFTPSNVQFWVYGRYDRCIKDGGWKFRHQNPCLCFHRITLYRFCQHFYGNFAIWQQT